MPDPRRSARGRARPASRLRLAAAYVACCVLVSGCFGADDGSSEDDPDGSPGEGEVEVRATVRKVSGELSPDRRRALADQAERLVAGYLEAGFLDPERARAARFPGFTPGARRSAVRDADLLTREAFGDVDGLDAREATADLFVFAHRGRAAGVTARVRLALTVTDGDRSEPASVRGRLLLTPTGSGWRVFGYDLVRTGWSGAADASGGDSGKKQ